ncbi:hypothetical protein NAL32_08325 [Chryseobacterium sp. Ch-15]|uniref:Uncharacterized protein n=2 Tax=Chryseobacterium muglaense TaxID=2893752 RepID=A0A9Q3YSX6_9FLAO|nr:hypothetical protein [Chryseobacterium muglaense]MCC9035873.1 hypothetical protein [Chryseobacterium muglaense]MCM2554398.1 hypothetical protein [Chryseobacterium muglaense]
MITKNNIITAAAVLFMGTLLIPGQISIGSIPAVNSSVSLEFGSENRGIVLPWVTSTGAVAGAVDGTMVYDLSDHKVKTKYASGWKDLSVDLTGVTGTAVDIQNSATENTDAKVSIGTPTSVPGILVLEDTDKAMVLPKVASPHLNIINPAPGMMAYDTTAKQLAVFNGTVWSFWKP